MSRIRMIALVTAVAALALAGIAVASPAKPATITGGSTTLTISSAVASALSASNLSLTAIAPATESGSTFTFPISGGRLNAKLHGYIVNDGGFSISNGTRTVRMRHLTVYVRKAGAAIYALTDRSIKQTVRCRVGARRRHVVCTTTSRFKAARIAKITDITIGNGPLTGNVELTAFSAKVINALAGKTIVAAATPLGTATASPTLS